MKYKNKLLGLICALIILSLGSCLIINKSKTCPFPYPSHDWMEVGKLYNSKIIIELASKFELAAKNDLERIRAISSGTISASSSFASEYLKILNSTAQKRYTVSQDFYLTYIKWRGPICGLGNVTNGSTLSEDDRRIAEEIMLYVTNSWSQIKESEQTKISGQ